MHYDECETFPNCKYNPDSIKDLTRIYPSDRISTYSDILDKLKNKDYNPITSFQPLMIVFCGEGGKIENSEDLICEFETSFFTDKDTINIYEDNTFSQYLLYGENETY